MYMHVYIYQINLLRESSKNEKTGRDRKNSTKKLGIYIHIYIYAYIYVYIYTYIYVKISAVTIDLYSYMHICIYVYILKCMHICMFG
jgi:hypothetical protein